MGVVRWPCMCFECQCQLPVKNTEDWVSDLSLPVHMLTCWYAHTSQPLTVLTTSK